jgi:hypothetical protein
VVLPYCIVESEAEVRAPEFGVADAAVCEFCESGLRCFYSAFEPPADEGTATERAMEFRVVVSAIFDQAQTVPFRFGHTVESEAELRSFVVQRAETYLRALQEFRDKVQIDVRLLFLSNKVKPASGREYMDRIRQQSAMVRQAADELKRVAPAEGWRERELRDGVRCYALLRRESLPAFRKAVAPLHFPEPLLAIASGPWPPAEFMELDDAQFAPSRVVTPR